MPLYCCRIRGEDFPGALAGILEPVGFYATRYVEAPSPEEAEEAALTALRMESAFDVSPQVMSPDARIYFEAVVEVPPDTVRTLDNGFTFFSGPPA